MIWHCTSALIKDFPEHYQYILKNIQQWHISKKRNRLLWRDDIFDGGKTGYTSKAGYCSRFCNERRHEASCCCLGSEDKRFNDVTTLMTYGFSFNTVKLFTANNQLKLELAGVADTISVGVAEDIILTLSNDERELIRYEVETEKRILAPVNAFEKAGTLKVLDSEDNLLAEADLIYLENVEELGFFQRLWAIFWDWLVSLFS